MTAGLADDEDPSHHPRHEVDLGGFRYRLVDGTGQALAFPCPPAIEQRSDDRYRELFPGDVVGVPHLGGDWRQIVPAVRGRIVAAVHHDAAESEVHQVRCLEVRPRAVVTKGRHPRHDEGGKLPQQCLSVQTQPVELSPRRGLQKHVGGRDQCAESVALCRLAQIEHDGALPAVVLPEEQRAFGVFTVLVEGSDTARGASAGGLHFDDIGAEPSQAQSTVFRLFVRQFDDSNAGERTAPAPRGAGRRVLVLRAHVSPTSPALRACGPGRSRTRAPVSAPWPPACLPPRSCRTRPSRGCVVGSSR